MQRLDSFDFDSRPSRSRYAEVVSALVDEGVAAVKLVRGEDFPADIKMDTVQAGVSTAVRKAGKRAQTYVVSRDELVVRINPDQATRRRGKRREMTTA